MLPHNLTHSDRQKGFATKQLLVSAMVAFLLVVTTGVAIGQILRSLEPQTTPTDKDITLTYWGLWEEASIIQPLLDEYNQLHPNVTVKYEQRPIANYFSSVTSRFDSDTEDAPDIVRLHDSWLSVMHKDLSPIPSSIMSANEYESNFYTVNRDQLRYNGKYYAMPLEVDGLALVYNQDLFNAAGINKPPATWDDLRQYAARLTKRDSTGKITVAGVAMGTANNVDHYPDIVGLLMAQNKVQFLDSKGKSKFNNSIAPDGRNLGAEALAFYTVFSATDKVWSEDMDRSTVAFSEGKVSMIFIPSWQLLSLVSQNPNIPLKVASVPQLTTDQQVGYASYWVEAVPEASQNKAAAWEFLTWLSENSQRQQLAENQKQVRLFSTPFARVDMASLMDGDSYLEAYASQASGLRASFLAGNTGDNEFNSTINQALVTAIGQAKGQQAAAATALDAMAEVVDKTLSE